MADHNFYPKLNSTFALKHLFWTTLWIVSFAWQKNCHFFSSITCIGVVSAKRHEDFVVHHNLNVPVEPLKGLLSLHNLANVLTFVINAISLLSVGR